MTALITILLLTVFVAMTVGYLGYLAFGNGVKSVILYSLPNQDPAAITAKIFYILTIMGSLVILIQPVYYIIESSNWYKWLGGVRDEDEENKKKEEIMMEAAMEKSDGTKEKEASEEEDDSMTCC